MRPSPLVLLWMAALTAACSSPLRTGSAPGSPIGESPISRAEVTIHSITKEEAESFKASIEDQGRVQNVVLKNWQNNTAVYELEIEGCECDLPAKVAAIPRPGFRYEGRTTKMRFTAFDNQPPTVTVVYPDPSQVLVEADQYITFEIPDQDVVEVKVNDVVGERYRGNVYRAKVHLENGTNDLVVSARDKQGNEAKVPLRVVVDTTPPSAKATVKMIVEGDVAPGSSVLIDGKEVPVDSGGHYKAEVPIRKGQTEVEIIAIDKGGNKNVSKKVLGE